jgi:hypothetical protein
MLRQFLSTSGPIQKTSGMKRKLNSSPSFGLSTDRFGSFTLSRETFS